LVADQVALDPLAPEAVAAHLAPVIDRLRLAVARRTMELSAAGGLIESAGLDKAAFQLLLMLRNVYPHRAVTLEQLGAPFTYQDPGAADRLVGQLVEAQLLQKVTDGSLRLSDAGRDLMDRMHLAGAQAVTELWGTGGSAAMSALPLVDRALVAAAPSGGPGFALMTPTYDAPGASTEIKLSERLAGLRFHRFDAHVASWTGAGCTAEAIKALGPGPERTAIEQETNRRAGTAYAALDPSERLALLAALGSLPGS
jgi:hypothetical protein